MLISRGQCAWLVNKRLFTSHQRLNGEHLKQKNSNRLSFFFFHFEKKKNKKKIQWLVGFTDGDGNFSITKQAHAHKWGLSFKLAQSRYNLRLLNYVKKELGVASITKDGTIKKKNKHSIL